MKHIGSVCCSYTLRDKELLAAFKKVFTTASLYESMDNILQRAVDFPSSRFWVSEERAAIVLAEMDRGVYHIGNPIKDEMYRELYRVLKKVRSENPDLPMCELAYLVVNSPAPKFFLSIHNARVILRKHIRFK